jgi:anti-anti-sigma factor
MSECTLQAGRRQVTLTVTTTWESAVLTAAGSLDLAVADHLLDRLSDEIALRPRAVVVDLSQVTFCSARILRTLLEASAQAHAAEVPFVLVSDQRAVRRPIELLRLGHLLQLHHDLTAARQWLAVLHGAGEHPAAG